MRYRSCNESTSTEEIGARIHWHCWWLETKLALAGNSYIYVYIPNKCRVWGEVTDAGAAGKGACCTDDTYEGGGELSAAEVAAGAWVAVDAELQVLQRAKEQWVADTIGTVGHAQHRLTRPDIKVYSGPADTLLNTPMSLLLALETRNADDLREPMVLIEALCRAPQTVNNSGVVALQVTSKARSLLSADAKWVWDVHASHLQRD